jgi:hypothetical protein
LRGNSGKAIKFLHLRKLFGVENLCSICKVEEVLAFGHRTSQGVHAQVLVDSEQPFFRALRTHDVFAVTHGKEGDLLLEAHGAFANDRTADWSFFHEHEFGGKIVGWGESKGNDVTFVQFFHIVRLRNSERFFVSVQVNENVIFLCVQNPARKRSFHRVGSDTSRYDHEILGQYKLNQIVVFIGNCRSVNVVHYPFLDSVVARK